MKIDTIPSTPAYQLGKVKLFCPYGDGIIITPESKKVLQELCLYCQKIFSELISISGILPMFDTTLQQRHLDQMVQNIIAMRKEEVFLKFECTLGDIELSCDLFTLGGSELSFELTDYLIVMVDVGCYSIYLTDVHQLYLALSKKIKRVQQKFADQVSPFFVQEVNFFSGKEPVGLCCINE